MKNIFLYLYLSVGCARVLVLKYLARCHLYVYACMYACTYVCMVCPKTSAMTHETVRADLQREFEPWRYSKFEPPPTIDADAAEEDNAAGAPPPAVFKYQQKFLRAAAHCRDTPLSLPPSNSHASAATGVAGRNSQISAFLYNDHDN
jgi:hypothetical protein